MATGLRPGRLDEIARTESLNDALRFCAELMDGRVTGRIALEVSR